MAREEPLPPACARALAVLQERASAPDGVPEEALEAAEQHLATCIRCRSPLPEYAEAMDRGENGTLLYHEVYARQQQLSLPHISIAVTPAAPDQGALLFADSVEMVSLTLEATSPPLQVSPQLRLSLCSSQARSISLASVARSTSHRSS